MKGDVLLKVKNQSTLKTIGNEEKEEKGEVEKMFDPNSTIK